MPSLLESLGRQGLYTQQCHFHNNSAGWDGPLSHQDMQAFCWRDPRKSQDILKGKGCTPTRTGHASPCWAGDLPTNLWEAFSQKLHLSDMNGLCPSLSEGSAFGDTVVSQPYPSHKTFPQWSQALGAPDTGPSNGSQQVSTGWKGSASQGDTHRCTSRERKSPSYFVNTLKHFGNKIIAVKTTDSTELIPPTLNCYPGAARSFGKGTQHIFIKIKLPRGQGGIARITIHSKYSVLHREEFWPEMLEDVSDGGHGFTPASRTPPPPPNKQKQSFEVNHWRIQTHLRQIKAFRFHCDITQWCYLQGNS